MARAGQVELLIDVHPQLNKGAMQRAAAEVRTSIQGAASKTALFDGKATDSALSTTKRLAQEAAKDFDHLEKSASHAGQGASTALKSAASGGGSLGNLGNQLRGVDGRFQAATKSGSGFGGMLGNMKGLVAGLGLAGLATGIVGVGTSMVQGNAVMERYSTQLGVLIGDTKQTQVLLDDLKKFGASTPFEFPELAEASRNLIAFGFSAKETVPELKKVGDISSAVGAPIGEIAELYGKARVQGTLMAEDINQLLGRGIPVIQEFAKQLGVSEGEVKKLASEGKLKFENLQQAFTDLTSEGGKFAGMMEAQSKTFEGLVSTAKDNVAQLLTAMGGPLFDAVKGGLGSLIEVLNGEAVQNAVASVGKAVGGIVNVVVGVLEKLLPVISSLLGPIGTILTTLLEPLGAILDAVLVPVAGMIQQIAGPLGTLLVTAAQIVSGVLMPVIAALSPILQSISTILGSVASAVLVVLNAFLPLIELALQPVIILIQLLATVLDAILSPIASVIQQVGQFIQQMMQELQPAIDEGITLFKELASLVGGILTSVVRGVIQLFFRVIDTLNGMILKLTGATSATELFQKVLGFVRGVVEKVVGAFRTLRGVIEGVRSAFEVVRATLKSFIDAVLSLDVGAAIKAFAGFGEKIGNAYKAGFNRVTGEGDFFGKIGGGLADAFGKAGKIAGDLAEKNAEEAEKKNTEAGKKGAKKGADEIKQLKEQLAKEVEKAASDARVDAIEDSRKRELVAQKEGYDQELVDLGEKYKKIAEADANYQTLLTLRAGAYAKDREDLIKKLNEEGLKANVETFRNARQQEIEILRGQSELIIGEDAKSIRRRNELRRQELETQKNLELGLLARQTDEFKTAFAELDRDLLQDKITPEIYEQKIREFVASAIENAADGSDIDLAAKNFALKIEKAISQGEAEAQAAFYRDVEENIRRRTTDLAALEHKLRLLELRKAYDEELRAAGENAALRAEADRKFLAQKYDLEQEYLAQRNDAVAGALAFEKGLRKSFLEEVDDEQQKALQSDLDRLQTERDRLKEQYKQGRVSFQQYKDDLLRISKESADKQAQIDEGAFSFTNALAKGLSESAAIYEEEKRARIEESTAKLLEASKAGQAFTAESAKRQLALLSDYGKATLGELSGAFGTMLAEGEVKLAALGNIILKNLFDLAQKEILVLTPVIFTKAASLLGPILGPIAAVGVIGTVQAGLAFAKSQIKFHTGGVDVGTKDGPRGTEFGATLLRGETVLTVGVTQRERPLLDYLQKGGSSREFFVERYKDEFQDGLAREGIGLLNRRVAENTDQLRQVNQKLEGIEAGQKDVAKRFRSETHTEHTFKPIEVDGRTIKVAIDKATVDDLSL